MSENYKINVTDEAGKVLIAGEGPVKVFYYLAENAALMLEELGSDSQVTATIHHGDRQILNVPLDAESAASLIKGRSLKIRRGLAEAAQEAAASA